MSRTPTVRGKEEAMDLKPKYETGDLVVLNSGGPTMTVTKVDPDCDWQGKFAGFYVGVSWFDGATTLCATFHEAMLRLGGEDE